MLVILKRIQDQAETIINFEIYATPRNTVVLRERNLNPCLKIAYIDR